MARKKTHKREAQLGFETISIEGGLLSPEWLSRVAQLGAESQSEADYRIPKGLNLRDEIGRYWRIAQAHYADFAKGRAAGGDATALAERFVDALLKDSFGFGTLAAAPAAVLAERSYPIGFAALAGRVPVIIAPTGVGLDTPLDAFGDDGRKRSAFGLVQEYLNAEDAALWGLCSDGTTLRIVRDNASLTRPAWIEADVARIFSEERYADFAALWLLVHETRFGRPDQPVAECALEAWRTAGRQQGTRARDKLRQGVEDALIALGQGFLAHSDNQALRAALQDGSLTTKDYFNQLLRLVYRLIFLLTVEERDLLHPPGTTEPVRLLYRDGYGMRRLRDRSVKRSAHDRFHDQWDAAKIVFRGLAAGEPRLGLPALAGIFAKDRTPALDAARLPNSALLLAVFRLSWLREDSGLARVNWRDMGPEELGSVYESLLELVPLISDDRRKFGFATGAETRGNARKTTGSYYTPDSLVQVLLDSALEPVIADTIAKHADTPVDALLELSIVDPACGSGHFLLAAARRLAAHVARLRAGATPSAAEYRHAVRQVIGRCVYGVDLNPMAVELCKVSLWMEAVEPGLPLTFLDSHIQHGNALLGTTPELMADGIPDAAWEPIEGDDKKVASALKKQNKQERSQKTLDFAKPPVSTFARLGAGARAVDDEDDTSLIGVEGKERHWGELIASYAYAHQRFVADLWCSAFVWKKELGPLRDLAPTESTFRVLEKDSSRADRRVRDEVDCLRQQYRFFHWPLAFPQVFAKGGFDVVLGNPPWERVKLQEQEFFALRHEEIANAPNAAARKKLIAGLPVTDPQLWTHWCAASRNAEGESHFVRNSKRYPLCGKGDVNTYTIFAEHNLNAIGAVGRAGFIVPSGIATDDTTKEYFGSLARSGRLSSLFDFRNHDGLFYDVGHRRFKFCLLTVLGRSASEARALLVFFAESAAELYDPNRQFTLSPADVELLNPNTGTCPTFRSRRDAGINLAIYRRNGVLWREGDPDQNPWRLRFMAMLHMANDSGVFKTSAQRDSSAGYLPLLEAKMVHHFDHRYGDYADRDASSQDTQLPDVPIERLDDPAYCATPKYWVPAGEVDDRLVDRWSRGWLMGWRDICRSTDERTVIASVIPRAAVGHTTPLMMPDADPSLIAALYANLCSFALDYCARQKVGGTHLTYNFLKQLPVLSPVAYSVDALWHRGTMVRDWLLPRVLELTYTAWDLELFARDLGYLGPPFRWDPTDLDRRFLLRCELDAAFFHLYDLSKDDTEYVMNTFPIVRRNDEKLHDGKFRTKEVILSIYDEMAEAARTGSPYRTRLAPPPADPRVAHAPRVVVPDWDRLLPAAVAAGLWKRPGIDQAAEAAVSLVAVLKAFGVARPAREVRLAATMALEPRLLSPFLTDQQAGAWRRLLGADAAQLPPGTTAFIPPADAAWGRALRQLRSSDVLVDDPGANTWGPGSKIAAIDTAGWPDGRARVVAAVLGQRREEEIAQVLPDNLRRWVNGEAAA